MSNARKFLWSVAAVFAVAALLLFAEWQSGDDHGIIVKLELAPSIQEIEKLVSSYDDEHLQWLRLNTQLDFLFIVTYSSLFFFAATGLLEKMKRTGNLKWLTTITYVPAILDVIENAFILQFLQRDFGTLHFQLYHNCVITKWILVAAFVLLSIIYLGWIVYETIRKKEKASL